MRHFWYLDIAKKWCYATTCVQEHNTTSKECCIHSRTFFEGNTCSQYYCVCLLQRNSTVFKKNVPPFYAMCPILFQKSTASIKDFPCRQDSFKVLHSATKKCYMFSTKSPTIPSIVSVFQFTVSVFGLSGKVCGQKKRCWRDVSLQRYTMAQKKNLQSSLSGFKIQGSEKTSSI